MMKSVIASALALVAISQPLFAAENIADLEKAARGEGQLQSIGMPDSWANWKDTWQQLGSIYGIKHQDTDMSSAQEIAKFAAEKANATADIGDVGGAFGPVAVKQGVTQPYKPSTWADIPNWAKDADGHWMLAYTGTIAFLINKDLVKAAPTSWQSLLGGDYKVTLGDVGVGLPGQQRRAGGGLCHRRQREESETRPGAVRQAGQAGPSVAERPDHRQHREGRSGSGGAVGLQRPQLPRPDRPQEV